MFVAVNKKNIVTAVSDQPFVVAGAAIREIPSIFDKDERRRLIGTRLSPIEHKDKEQLRIAIICNWNEPCGISTYTKFLVEALSSKVKEIGIFSERGCPGEDPRVLKCWERGHSMRECIDKLVAWDPDFVVIQHEFGIFPKATYFLQLLQGIDSIPYIVVMHSVYEHLDKSVCTAAAKNIVTHSEEAKRALIRTGNSSSISVIPHGCVKIAEEERSELWNIFQTPYALIQFGFGFFYKGVDKVLDALHYLKMSDRKFQDIFYCYLCSDNPHTGVIHGQYYDFLLDKIEKLDLRDNVAIIKKFQTEQTINNYLRTAKIALFPYVNDPKNQVYGASGAVRIAMANGIPVIASSSHMFDDLEGVVPRPDDYASLAKEIDNIFSDERYRNSLLDRMGRYVNGNDWSATADRYIDVLQSIRLPRCRP